MPLQKFVFRPGINKESTAYANEGGWFDSNLVRFRKGLPEKIGVGLKLQEPLFYLQDEQCMLGLITTELE